MRDLTKNLIILAAEGVFYYFPVSGWRAISQITFTESAIDFALFERLLLQHFLFTPYQPRRISSKAKRVRELHCFVAHSQSPRSSLSALLYHIFFLSSHLWIRFRFRFASVHHTSTFAPTSLSGCRICTSQRGIIFLPSYISLLFLKIQNVKIFKNKVSAAIYK